LATAVLGTSLVAHMGILPAYHLYFHYTTLLQIPPQIWRLVTCFLVTPPGLSMLFDTYFSTPYVEVASIWDAC
jgi:Derlin-2/3